MRFTLSRGNMKRFIVKTASKTDESCVIKRDGFRVSVLTPGLIRIEKGAFCDEATQCVWCRDFERPSFNVSENDAELVIRTTDADFYISKIRKAVVKVVLKDGRIVRNFSKGVLPGTRRTLDMTDGKVRLGKSVVSKNGVAVLDDSRSLVLKDDKILQREKCSDKYVFAYGNAYRDAIRALYALTGFTPLLPKFALGNWWSRYKAYTQKEYTDLMQTFIDRQIPVTVATIDMDWHWVDVVRRFGKDALAKPTANMIDRVVYASMPGWTGYSWNTELFPDYRELLGFLNKNGFKVTLNLHPAQGVRYYEDMYGEVCKICGVDPASHAPVCFSLADENYLRAYFDVLHRPYQREGVRFWWIDWQQGKHSDVKRLDPLWALNHYHTLDMRDEGKRPLILSRYAGIGSHRYPIGFSGDSAMTWKTLDFQPYMTSSATNVGYSWWSHDIGGHHMGYKDDELYLRWLQFGVFSPINRLHSTSNEFMGKEPWKTKKEVEKSATDYLRLRHRLIPYLYSINYLTHTQGVALCEPMYYSYDKKQAYATKNQYSFGTQLVVAPITQKTDPHTNLASTKLWVPEGERYTDIFTGRIYGEGEYEVYRDLEDFPVFAKKGSIIPLYKDASDNGTGMDKALEVLVYSGDGEFTIYDDDGDTLDYEKGRFVMTKIIVRQNGDTLMLSLSSDGDKDMAAAGRNMTLVFKDVVKADISTNAEGAEIKENTVTLFYDGKDVTVTAKNCVFTENPPFRDELIDLVSKFQGNNMKKAATFGRFLKDKDASMLFVRRCFAGPIKELKDICKK